MRNAEKRYGGHTYTYTHARSKMEEKIAKKMKICEIVTERAKCQKNDEERKHSLEGFDTRISKIFGPHCVFSSFSE